ncbi:TetR/AcrR family transcriptional regulator [Phyllobacterium sp. LjRoot231]|uniref:TetR/AcrR family transcriptional regulator n=1 Tax=Phyllobacterium sp. LjRoot231 TaxID=3342289 RepID=UPI003ECCF8B2
MLTNSTRRSAATVDQILDATEEVLLAHGITGLTLNAVAAQAKITKGGLLYHFRTKNDLERGIESRFIARIEQRLSKLRPATDRFSSAMIAEIWDDWQKGPKHFASLILSAGNGPGSEQLRAFGASLLGRFDAQSPTIQYERLSFFAMIGLILTDLLNLVEISEDEAARIHLAIQMLVNNG